MVSLKHEISLSSNFDLSSRKFIHTSLFHHEQGEKVNWTNKHTKCEVHDSFCQLFFFFPLKEKRIVRKKTASVTIWGFILQSLLTPPESGYRWWNISYYFPKNTVELRKTCSSSSTTNTCNRENANYLKGFLITQLPSRFSRVRLCATSWTADYQASLSMGFSRQEHWSGLPFPSPMHESGKWKWSHSVMSDS